MERDPSSVSRDEVPFSYNILAVAAFACRPGQYDDVIEGRQAGEMYYSILNKLMAASRCFFVMSSASRICGICNYRGSFPVLFWVLRRGVALVLVATIATSTSGWEGNEVHYVSIKLHPFQ